jgi:hypothetical protein
MQMLKNLPLQDSAIPAFYFRCFTTQNSLHVQSGYIVTFVIKFEVLVKVDSIWCVEHFAWKWVLVGVGNVVVSK